MSTNDTEVKSCLRQLGQPICLFGEDAGFRRERLKASILDFFIREERAPEFCLPTAKGKRREADSDESFDCYDQEGNQTSVFYSEAEQTLKEARMQIAKFSLPKG